MNKKRENHELKSERQKQNLILYTQKTKKEDFLNFMSGWGTL